MSVIITTGLSIMLLLTAGDCEGGGGPGTKEYNDRHHINESRGALPNPDPAPREPGTPPPGVGVTFRVAFDKSAGRVIATYNAGHGQQTMTITGGYKTWGSIILKGTPVSLLVVHASPGKVGSIRIQIIRDVGGLVCTDSNDETPTGGADCAGVV